MGATVTNQDKGVTTKTSDHTYATLGPTDVCMNPPVTVAVPHPNYVKTEKAVEHTSGKTLFQNGNVVRVQEALMPSDPAHGDIGAGGGVKSHTYRLEARATSGSPNVRVEGLPPVRTDDPTTQNHANTTGKVFQVVPPALLQDNPEDYFKRCSYDTSTITCDCDFAKPVKMPQIDVKRGNNITIDAKRKNAKVKDEPPECANPTHMKWKVTRTGGVDADNVPIPPKYEEFSGDKLELKDWLPKVDLKVKKRDELKADKRKEIEAKNNYAAENAAARGSSRVENQDGQAGYARVKQDRQDREAHNEAAKYVNVLTDFNKFMIMWRAAQNPVRLAIVGNACSGSVTYEVHGYPEPKMEVEIPLEGLSKAVAWISRAMDTVRKIGSLANVRVENSLKFPAGDIKITLGFEWKEGENEDAYTMVNEAGFKIGGKIFEWKFEVSVPLTNFLSIIPFGGYLASKAIGWIIQRIGADASLGFAVEVSLSADAGMTFSWNKKRGFKWEAAMTFPIEAKIYGYIRIKWRDNLHIEGRIIAQMDPALKIEGTSAGLVLKNKNFIMKAGLSGFIKVSVSFYTYEDTAEKFPECLTCKVPETELWNIIGN
ncbi:MAG TPA: DUF4150 domain-containing protein [Polyangium sp.]|nr:DUF4150 domain-containing protein [Polyangium sp.]